MQLIKFKISVVSFTFSLFIVGAVTANTYYIAVDGNDNQPGSSAKPWATFQHAYNTISGGDTLIIKDGLYDQQFNAGDRIYEEEIFSSYGNGIPSGTENAYTVIKAENDWGVVVADELTISPASCIQIQGIHFLNGGYMSGSHHIKIIRCSFKGIACEGNETVISAGTGCSYILFEECFAYGCNRYKFMAYGDQNVTTEKIIFRRCVSRHDYHDPSSNWGGQCATFTSYDCHDFMMQNCISINSGDDDENLYGYLYGGIWFENKETTPADNSAVIQGCIFLNLAGSAAINDPKNNGTHIIENCVIWDSKGGYGGGVISGSPTLRLNHLTLGNIWGEFQDMSYSWGTGVITDNEFSYQELRNSLIVECNSYGIANYVNSDYNNFYNNSENFGNSWAVPVPQAGTHDMFHDPGLKYICRLEDDSPLKGTAADGGDRGANIFYRRGVSGTLWGEPGFDQLTNEPLWPFPNENTIKAMMSSWNGQNDAQRGFCEVGTGLYGGPITLTSYIWEYLGYPCPEDVCNPDEQPSENLDLNMHCYPNPVTDDLNIEFDALLPGPVSISIYDIQGRLIHEYPYYVIRVGTNTKNISTMKYADGCYFVKLKTNSQSEITKLIVMH